MKIVIIIGTNSNNIFNIVISKFTFEIKKELVNSNFCNISTLEVYRGREQAIEISNVGFSLNHNGSITVRQWI